jgi:hypothetical protein
VQGARLFPGQGPLHYRQQMLHEARTQTGQLPLLLAQVEALVTRVDSATDSLHTRMLEGQEDLQNKLVTLHTGLFEHVGQSLRESFAASGREAGESMAPILRDTMQAIAAQTEATQMTVRDGVDNQLAALAEVREQAAQSVHDTRALVASQASAVAAQDSLRLALEATVRDAGGSLDTQAANATAMLQQVGEQLSAHREQLEQQWLAERTRFNEQQQARLEAQAESVQSALTAAMTTHAQLTVDTLRPIVESTMAGLDSAVATVRQEASEALQRDETLLQSQRELMTGLQATAGALAQDSAAYRSTLEVFAQQTATALDATALQFASTVGQEADRLAEVGGQFAAGAQGLTALGDALGSAVAQFDAVAQGLSATLQQLAQGMEEAAGRSDEQLAYYVAQAREVIDHSALAQQKLLDQLREISRSV